jgi:hypothetical protein
LRQEWLRIERRGFRSLRPYIGVVESIAIGLRSYIATREMDVKTRVRLFGWLRGDARLGAILGLQTVGAGEIEGLHAVGDGRIKSLRRYVDPAKLLERRLC